MVETIGGVSQRTWMGGGGWEREGAIVRSGVSCGGKFSRKDQGSNG